MEAEVYYIGGYCCRGECCGPGSWCCANAGEHKHEDMNSE